MDRLGEIYVTIFVILFFVFMVHYKECSDQFTRSLFQSAMWPFIAYEIVSTDNYELGCQK